jgi:hypothetical protein
MLAFDSRGYTLGAKCLLWYELCEEKVLDFMGQVKAITSPYVIGSTQVTRQTEVTTSVTTGGSVTQTSETTSGSVTQTGGTTSKTASKTGGSTKTTTQR